MRPFVLGLQGVDVWWVAFSAFVTVFAGALALTVKRMMGWMLRRARAGFLEWFGEAIDSHVAPKFDEIRDELLANTNRAEAAIKTEQHEAIRAEVAPIVERLDTHVTNDDVIMAAAGEALVAGQDALKQTLDHHHAEAMEVIQRHVEDDAAAFLRIEERLDPE